MLPASFISTYKKYKHDTDVVASWLAATAKQRGYTAPFAAPPNTAAATATSKPTASSGRLKGKARKQAKQQQRIEAIPVNNTKETPDAQEKPKYVLAIRDFVPLAEFIAGKMGIKASPEADNGAGIPTTVSSALQRVIQVRKAFSSRLGEVKQSLSAHANATHAHFVGVLEKVRDILLKPDDGAGELVKVDAVADGQDSTSKSTASSFNLFDALRLYETSEAFLNAPDVERPAPVELEYTVESDESDAEAMFAFIAFLKDLINLRDQVGELWREYKGGGLDLAAAAVGTNLAIELAHGMEEEVAPLLKKLGGALKIIPMVFQAACESQGLDHLDKELPTDDMNFECYELGSAFLFNAASFLDALLRALPYDGRDVPSYNGKFGWYDAETSHWQTENRQRWAQDKAALLEAVPDMVVLSQLNGIPVQDELARGIKTMFETQEIPVWLCFAAQNYLDTLRFLGPNVDTTQYEFRGELNHMMYMIKGAKEKGGSYMKKELDDINSMVNIYHEGKDVFTILRSTTSDRRSSFLLHNPTLCGVWINYIRAIMHRTAIAYAAKPGHVLHAVQLYEAAREYNGRRLLAIPLWPDMQELLDMQGHQAFFVGGETPSSAQAHFKNYCMSRGISPTNWLAAANRRKLKGGKVPVQTSRAGIRELKFKAPASNWCASRAQRGAAGNATRRVLNAEVVQQLLEVSGWTGESKSKQPTMSAPQLVRHVVDIIDDEVHELAFNYMALNAVAEHLLSSIKHSAQDLGLPRMPPIMTDYADYAGLVFATAAGEVESASRESDGVLGKIAELIMEFLPREFELTSADFIHLSNGCAAHQVTSTHISLADCNCHCCHGQYDPDDDSGDDLDDFDDLDDLEDDSDDDSVMSAQLTTINLQARTVETEKTFFPLRKKKAAKSRALR